MPVFKLFPRLSAPSLPPRRVRWMGVLFAACLLVVGAGSTAAYAQECSAAPAVTESPYNPAVNVGSSGDITLTVTAASGAPASCLDYMESPSLAGSDASDFSVLSTTCPTKGSSTSCTIVLAFTPPSAGSFAATVDIQNEYMNEVQQLTGAIPARGVVPTSSITVSPSALSCAGGAAGMAQSCGSITVTANGGPVTLGSTPLAISGGTEFQVSAGTCVAGSTIAEGSSCTSGPVTLTAPAPGSFTATVGVSTSNAGSGSVGVSGSAEAFQCTPNAAKEQYCLISPI